MRIALIGVLLLPLLAACGGGAASTSAPATDAPPPAAVDVQIANFAFDPRSATAPVGAAVTWTNEDSAPHTVTFDEGVDLGQVSRDGTLTRTFESAGEFAYICTIHPSMRGVVVVQ